MRFSLLPFLLLVVPIVEIGTFLVIGDKIGIAATLGMILVTAIVGTALLRHQGLSLINKIQTEMNAGRVPGRALSDGAMILVAGILLLTPGFVTDSIGFLLFVPFVRNAIWSFIATRIQIVGAGMGAGGMASGSPFGGNPYSDPQSHPNNIDGDGPVIDLDAEDFSSGKPDPNSPWNKPD